MLNERATHTRARALLFQRIKFPSIDWLILSCEFITCFHKRNIMRIARWLLYRYSFVSACFLFWLSLCSASSKHMQFVLCRSDGRQSAHCVELVGTRSARNTIEMDVNRGKNTSIIISNAHYWLKLFTVYGFRTAIISFILLCLVSVCVVNIHVPHASGGSIVSS